MSIPFKPSRCPHCKKKMDAGQRIHPACIDDFAQAQAAKSARAQAKRVLMAAKVDKALTRAKRESLKSKAAHAKDAQTAVNKYVRLRDMLAGRGCITCGARPAQKAGGTMDAGHFRSVGSAPHLRFFTPQIALQCVTCNRYQGGRALDFRKALVNRNGSEWVEALEGMQGLAKFDISYLQRLKSVFTKRAKRLSNRLEMALSC